MGATPKPEHWGPTEAAWPTPADELEDIEIGFRPSWWLLRADFARRFGPDDAVLMLMAQVADRVHSEGVPFPAEWTPAILAERT